MNSSKAIGVCILKIYFISLKAAEKYTSYLPLTRRGSEVRITDLAEILGYVFGYRNMKKAAILDSNAKKTKVLSTFSFIMKKVLKITFS